MVDEVNGHNTLASSIKELRAWMMSFIDPIVVGAVNGILRSMPQIPLEEVMIMTCALFGRMIGNTLSIGDIAPVLDLRRKCKEAFTTEMSKVTVRPMAAQPSAMDAIRKSAPSH